MKMRFFLPFLILVWIVFIVNSCMNLNKPPIVPDNPIPKNNSIDISITPTLSWNCTDPDDDPLIYTLYLGKDTNPEEYKSGIKGNNINIGSLEYNTTYYWRIEAFDGKGGITQGPLWSFKTRKKFNLEGEIKWKFKTNGSIYTSSPAVDNNENIYITSRDKKLYKISKDGKLLWSFEVNNDNLSSPVIDNDIVYFTASDGYLYAVEGGELLWKYEIGNSYKTPSITSEFIFVVSQDKLYKFDKSGNLLISKKYDYNIKSSISIKDNFLYFGCGNYLYKIDINGNVIKKFDASSEVNTPSLSEERIYITTFNGILYSLNYELEEIWKYNTGESIYSSATIGNDGTIYITNLKGILYALNNNGNEKWKFRAQHYIFSTPTVDDDEKIYFTSVDNYIYAVNKDGELVWKILADDRNFYSSAVIKNGVLYIGAFDNNLYAIYVSSNDLANSPWPKVYCDNWNSGEYNH